MNNKRKYTTTIEESWTALFPFPILQRSRVIGGVHSQRDALALLHVDLGSATSLVASSVRLVASEGRSSCRPGRTPGSAAGGGRGTSPWPRQPINVFSPLI